MIATFIFIIASALSFDFDMPALGIAFLAISLLTLASTILSWLEKH